MRTLKGLEDVIQMVVLDWELFPEGWYVFQLIHSLLENIFSLLIIHLSTSLPVIFK